MMKAFNILGVLCRIQFSGEEGSRKTNMKGEFA